MDLREEFERVIAGMEWHEIHDTVLAMVNEMLGGTPNPPPPPPPPAYSQGQYLPYQWPGCYVQPAAAPLHQYNNIPVVRLPDGVQENLVPLGIVNGEVVYGLPLAPAAPPPNTSLSQKRKHESLEDEGRPYVKKPPNAFMIFREEQRPNVVAELKNSNSAVVNTVLGQRWKSLSKEQQEKYYEKAEQERRRHTQQHPEWSCSQNYGKKRKRVRRKAPTRAEASAVEPEVTQQEKRLCVTAVQTVVMEPPTSLHPYIPPPPTSYPSTLPPPPLYTLYPNPAPMDASNSHTIESEAFTSLHHNPHHPYIPPPPTSYPSTLPPPPLYTPYPNPPPMHASNLYTLESEAFTSLHHNPHHPYISPSPNSYPSPLPPPPLYTPYPNPAPILPETPHLPSPPPPSATPPPTPSTSLLPPPSQTYVVEASTPREKIGTPFCDTIDLLESWRSGCL
ncbi:transcription factor 7-like 1-B [Trachinotus anak]|uniref:transcription factor 7-like 1-B n=1 Tax=Trachinotus anak TaxID=443729 RepID=UPI0039F209B7